MNGLTLLVVLAFAVGIVLAWRAGVAYGRRSAGGGSLPSARPVADAGSVRSGLETPRRTGARASATTAHDGGDERTGTLEDQSAALRGQLRDALAERHQLAEFAEERRQLLRELARSRGETARYRQLVVDLEDDAAPPLLDGPHAPDDLKLIVGIGPVLERMLHQLGVTTYRQIARWNERDIDEFDARLPEFPGRIRRDAWVTQARALHQSKFGETLPARER